MYISNKSQFYISCRQESMAMLLVRMEIMNGLTEEEVMNGLTEEEVMNGLTEEEVMNGQTEEEVIITKLICITRVLLWPTVTFIYGFFGHPYNKIKITPTQNTLLGV